MPGGRDGIAKVQRQRPAWWPWPTARRAASGNGFVLRPGCSEGDPYTRECLGQAEPWAPPQICGVRICFSQAKHPGVLDAH